MRVNTVNSSVKAHFSHSTLHLIKVIEVPLPVVFATAIGIARSSTAVSCKRRCTAQSELLTAITNCHCARVGERHKLVCVYSLTDPLIPATPPVSLLCPNLSRGLTGPGWQMGSRGQAKRGLCGETHAQGLTKPPQLHPGSSLTWPALTPRMERPHTSHTTSKHTPTPTHVVPQM